MSFWTSTDEEWDPPYNSSYVQKVIETDEKSDK